MTYLRPTGNPCSKEQRWLRVYSDWTRQWQFDGSLTPAAHGTATAACVGIRSIIDALLKPRQRHEPI